MNFPLKCDKSNFIGINVAKVVEKPVMKCFLAHPV